jgi:hypothetical protein
VTGIGLFDPDGPDGLDAYRRLLLMQVLEPVSLWLLAFAALPLSHRRENHRDVRKTSIHSDCRRP